MTGTGQVIAVDLGATSGRVVLGRVGGGELDVRVVARFDNGPVRTAQGLRWDLTGLLRATVRGLGAALRQAPEAASVGVDSWAVDYGLLRGGSLLDEPFHYRDLRTADGVARTHAVVSPTELYARTGLQFLPFTTLYQLAADRAEGRLASGDQLLLIPDLVTHLLGGPQVAERTNASTTGLLAVRTGEWDGELADRLGLPGGLLPPLVDPGTPLGRVAPLSGEGLGGEGLGGARRAPTLTAVASHDTASAVVAVPMAAERAAYISCGTWGLVGVELDRPVLTAQARAANFTNERGLDGRIRFLRNVMGLWLLDESVRAWRAAGEPVDLPGLLAEAAAVTGPVTVFDPDDPAFLTPGDLPGRIARHCREHDLPVPPDRAHLVRSVVESLAEAFAAAVRRAGELSGVPVRTVHLVGGGARNALLCQATARRTGLSVVAGPVEATALGNVLVQARSLGLVHGDLEALRALVNRAGVTRHYTPGHYTPGAAPPAPSLSPARPGRR